VVRGRRPPTPPTSASDPASAAFPTGMERPVGDTRRLRRGRTDPGGPRPDRT
jgi:hypothetical protein